MATPSLNELCKDVPPAVLEQRCSDRFLADVAKRIVDWKLLVPYMNISQSERHSIEESSRSYDVQKQDMLFKWKEKHSEVATNQALLDAFFSSGKTDLVSEACCLLQQQSSHTSEDAASGLCVAPVISSSLTDFQRKLKLKYIRHRPVMVNEWPPPPSLNVGYVKLVLLPKELVKRGEIKNEDIYEKICSEIDNELDSLKEVELQELLSPADERKVVLFEGAPGSGKSTLFWHICQKWASEELFQQFTLVLLVQLKDTALHKAESLGDLVPCLPSRSRQFLEIRECIEREIEVIQGEGVLILLDGWDEAPERLRQEGSLFHDLIAAPSSCSIEKAVVLVSSRPSASHDLWVHLSHRVELRGFTRQNRERYIRETLKNRPGDAGKLIEEIKNIEDNDVMDLCHPLNVASLIHVFSTSEGKLPTTPCRVMIKVVLSHLLRHIMKTQENKIKIPNSIENLPYPICVSFQNLCKIAYDAIVEEIFSFSDDDLISSSNIEQASAGQSQQLTTEPQEVITLGLLQSVHSLVATGFSTQYHFLHISLQELCAAYHVAKLPNPETTHIALKRCRIDNFESVCNFYAAFTNLKIPNITGELANKYCLHEDVIVHNKGLEKALNTDGSEVKWDCDNFLLTWSDLKYVAVVGNGNGYIIPSFFKLLVESENPNIIDAIVGKEIRINIRRDTERTFATVVRMAHSLETVTYKMYELSPKIFQALSNKQHLKKFVLFVFRYVTDCSIIESMLTALTTCPQLKDVFIRVRFSESATALQAASLFSTTFQNMSLNCVNIDTQNTMDDKAVAMLAPAIINTSHAKFRCKEVGALTLKSVSDVFLVSSSLKSIEITLEHYGGDDLTFFRSLKDAPGLNILVLYSCNGEPSLSDSKLGMVLLSGDLVSLAKLFGVGTSPVIDKTLHIHIFKNACIEIDFKNERFKSIGLVECQTKYESKLEPLKVKNKMDSTALHVLCESFLNVSVQEINLSGHRIGAANFKGAVGALQSLIIHDCGIGDNDIKLLFTSLAKTTTLTSLHASFNPFGDKGAIWLANYLNRTSLQVLDISSCNIKDKGMVAIASALRTNTTLRKLSLYSRERIIKQGTEFEFAKALLCNRTLTFFYVNQDPNYPYFPFRSDGYRTFKISLDTTQALLKMTSSSKLYDAIKSTSIIAIVEIHHDSPLGQALKAGSMDTIVDLLQLRQCPLGKGIVCIDMLDNSWTVNYGQKSIREQDAGIALVRGIQRNFKGSWEQVGCHRVGEGLIQLDRVGSSGQHLNLERKKLGYIGASLLAGLLNQMPLLELNVSCCGIGEEGIVLLASAVSTNTTIEHLAIGGNEFTMAGQEAMIEALSKNKTLTTLDVRTGRTIPPYLLRLSLADEEDFIRRIDEHSCVTKLYIDGNTPLGKKFEEKYISDEYKRTLLYSSSPNTIECQLKPFKVLRIYNKNQQCVTE